MDFSKLCCCTCDITKSVEWLWHLRTTLEYDVKSLENETDRLKSIKEQTRQEIEKKALDGKLPKPILNGWLERVEKFELDLRSINPPEKNTMIVNNNTQEPINSQTPPPSTTWLGRLCYKNWFKPQENTMMIVNNNTQEEPNSQLISPPTTCLGGLCYKNWFKAAKYQKRVIHLCQCVKDLVTEQQTFNMDELFVEDLGPSKLWCCTCVKDLRTTLEYDVKSLENETKRLKNIKEQIWVEIKEKRKLPKPILNGWLERVEEFELEVRRSIDPPHEENTMMIVNNNNNNNTQEEPINSQIISPPPSTTCLVGGLCYKNCCKAAEYQKRVIYLCQCVKDLVTEQQTFNMDELFVKDLGPADLPLDKTIGMDEIFNKVWHCLEDKYGARKRIIGIHGMAGVGKTTLLIRLNNYLWEETNRGQGYFNQVLWIDGHRGSDVKNVQLAIHEKLGLTWAENATPIARGAKIKAALKDKKCLLLIDDLRERLEFTHDVGIPMETKVVFTTSNRAACSAAEVETFQLDCLNEKDAGDLFQKYVGQNTLSSNSEIVPLAEQVIQLCDGLPLALVTVGKALSGKNRTEVWEHAIAMLSTQAPEYADIDQKVYDKLRVCYELLDTTAQPCFLYCSLFPKVCLVEEEELILHWFAENLITTNYGDALRAILNCGKSIITNLKDVYLLKNVESEETIAMHDMVRGTAKWIASERGLIRNKFWVEYGATLTELPEGTNSTQVLKISLVGCDIKGSMILECPNLSTLILKKSNLNKIGNDFFQSMRNLMVLDLSGGCEIISLPNHITSLTNLQYLNLSHTTISVLPENFKNLKKLKYLDLSYMNHLQMIPREVISKLLRLKFLNMYQSGLNETSRSVLSGDGEDLMRDLNVLENLVDLGITIKSDAAFEFLQNSKHMKCTHSLFIANCDELESLQLQMNVKVLGVLKCSKLRDVLLSIKQDSLRRVDIEDCDELNSFDWLKYACNLRFLRIVNCMKIEHIISVKKMEKKQVIIGEIEIECESSAEDGKRTFEIECESSAEAGKRMKRKQVNGEYGKGESLFSKLTHLHLENLPILKTICGHDLEICALEQIKVVDCPQLKKLPLDVNSNSKGALKSISGEQKWWDNLQMEEDAKSKFKPYFRKN